MRAVARLGCFHSHRFGQHYVPSLLHTSSSRSFASVSTPSDAKPLGPLPTQRDSSGRLTSRVSGLKSLPLNEQTLARFWTDIVRDHAERPALISRHEPPEGLPHSFVTSRQGSECLRWSYEEMDHHIQRLVAGLKQLGVRPGERVAVLMMNNSAMACLQIATAFVGAILVTLNPSYTSSELLKALNHVEASYLFLVPSLRSSNYLENLKHILPSLQSSAPSTFGDKTYIQDKECPSLRRIILVDNLTQRPEGWQSECILAVHQKASFNDAMQALNGRAISYDEIVKQQPHVDRDDVQGLKCHDIINLQLTSGTTGSPKAVALSSHNLVNNGIILGRIMKLTDMDVLANIPPLFHCFGLTLGNLAAWSAGAAVVYASEGFHPIRALRAASEEGATAIHGVPAHFVAELEILRQVRQAQKDGHWPQELADKGISSHEKWQFQLRTGFTSGSTVPIELMRAIMDKDLLGATEQTVVYGMTETSPVSFGCDTTADVELRCKTVGQVIPHVEAKIVAPDDPLGVPLPIGETGELCTAGYIVMDGGYWNDVQRTQEVLQQHPSEPDITWMRTGDLAVMDEHGYTEIRGRVKDLIIRGGENISAVSIENCIDMLQGVASAAAVSVPDERMGETVGVFIKLMNHAPAMQPSTVRSHVKAHLSGPSAPEWVWFLGDNEVPPSMPTTASGKVQKVILRQWARDLAQKGIGRVRSSQAPYSK